MNIIDRNLNQQAEKPETERRAKKRVTGTGELQSKLTRKPLIVGLGGTTRPDSSTEKALRYALTCAASLGADVELIGGADLMLPLYDPSNPVRDASAQRMIELLRKADGLILASPSYHGAVSGMMKNALDYVEDLAKAPRPYFHDIAVGSIICANGAQALGATLSNLRSIVHALRGWNTPFAATIQAGPNLFNELDEPTSTDVATSLRLVGVQVVQFAQMSMLAQQA